jgi:hypothetical protein
VPVYVYDTATVACTHQRCLECVALRVSDCLVLLLCMNTELCARSRIVLARGDRGPVFGQLTRWLDVELLDALSAHALTFAELRYVVDMISNVSMPCACTCAL